MSMAGSVAATHAVVVIHGTGGNAAGYFASMVHAATMAGVVDHTLVVALWFKTSKNTPSQGEAVWTKGGWKVGDGATAPIGVSSFTVIDQLLTTLADRGRFPNLRWITVAGHSAGGQFTQRYAMFGLAPNRLLGVLLNYIVANPSSFAYFSPVRPSTAGFTVPAVSSCPGFNDYKYGMAGRSGYVAALTPTQTESSYLARRVTLLTGGSDTIDNGDEDTSCGAKLEGASRAARSANYFSYIRAIAPNAPHDRVVIPGIGHDGDAMFASPMAWPVLFGVRPWSQARDVS
jgi:pimeloyl-ACP methyl ester carboxylesterase